MKVPNDARFAQARDELLRIGDRLREALPAEDAVAVDDVQEDLRGTRFDVAVIGQIKAGKSTFLNALMERPDLLPTNVSPWTAVITRLHFGSAEGEPDSGLFHFYTQSEWKRVRPQVSAAELIKNWHELEFRPLMGKTHTVEKVDARVLESYLAVGADPDRPEAGRYSPITREADLFFDQAPFPQPLTIVDTLGTNDPDHVREAITLEYVSRAQAYVMVVNGTQPMTRDDLALLTKLKVSLHRERLLLFINRMDRLAAADVAKVRNRVRRIVEDEFPGSEIPVLDGSAYWGNLASKAQPMTLKAILYNARFEALARERAIPRSELEAWRRAPEEHAAEIRHAILLVSGMLDARAAIADVLLREAGLTMLGAARDGLIVTAARAAEVYEREAIRQVETALTLEMEQQGLHEEIERLSRQATGLQEGRALLQMSLGAARQELETACASTAGALREALLQRVDRFAAEAEAQLAQAALGRPPRHWRLDLEPGREALSAELLERMRAAQQWIGGAAAGFRDVIQGHLWRLDPASAHDLSAEAPQEVPLERLLEPIEPAIELDLGGWWRRVRSSPEKLREAAARLRAQVEAELGRPAAELASAAQRSLEEASEATLRRFSEAAERAMDVSGAELERVQAELEHLGTRIEPEGTQELILAARGRAAEYRSAAAQLRKLEQEISGISLPEGS
jgi:hypothetical protein